MNTIYDGSFVLGSISATNFIAGNGIKIDEPSAGTVRIGNDETVLWSGTQSLNTPTAVNLSEPASSFKSFKIVWSPTYGSNMVSNTIDNFTNTNNIPLFVSTYWTPTGSTNAPWEFIVALSATGSNFHYLSDYKQRLNGQSSAINHHESVLYQVIGINRKEV